MNRERIAQRNARDERLRHAQQTGEYIDGFTTHSNEAFDTSGGFMADLNQRRANRGQKPL